MYYADKTNVVCGMTIFEARTQPPKKSAETGKKQTIAFPNF
jgi:hypothetical protein